MERRWDSSRPGTVNEEERGEKEDKNENIVSVSRDAVRRGHGGRRSPPFLVDDVNGHGVGGQGGGGAREVARVGEVDPADSEDRAVGAEGD